ncbi:hypothetical protein D3C80_1568480 [compost metagenome]
MPFELQKSLKNVYFQNHPLVKENKTIVEFEKEVPSSWWNNWYTYLLLLGGIILINKRSIDLFYLGVLSALGLFFICAGFYSFHKELAYNYNILLFNPTLLALLYFHFTKNKKGIYNLALFNLLSLFVYLIILINKAHLLLVLPMIVTSGVVLVKIVMKNREIPVQLQN